MPTIGTLFSGGELVGVGARNAGLKHLWGYEYKDEIAAVARLNGFNTITADVLKVDPRTLEVPDVLHASPVCTRASQANTSAELNEEGTKEDPLDIAAGEKVAEFIRVMRPRVFTLENVYAYRKFKAFKKITDELSRQGYMWDFNNCNSADFGVPQIRRRLILRAVRDSLLPPLPEPETWRGWFQAVEDLLPDCPLAWNRPGKTCQSDPNGVECRKSVYCRGHFAPWQELRMPDELRNFIIVTGNTNLIEGKAGGGVSFEDEPVNTIASMSGGGMPKAFLYAGQNTTSNVTPRDIEPAPTIAAFQKGGSPVAFILGQGERSAPIGGDAPAQTITGNSNQTGVRAFVVDEGKVVSMTVRCLARFQSVPNDYILRGKIQLLNLVIGNGVPCLMYEKIIRPMI